MSAARLSQNELTNQSGDFGVTGHFPKSSCPPPHLEYFNFTAFRPSAKAISGEICPIRTPPLLHFLRFNLIQTSTIKTIKLSVPYLESYINLQLFATDPRNTAPNSRR